MRPKYLITDRTALFIFFGLIALLLISLPTTQYFKSKFAISYKKHQDRLNLQLDSLKTIQAQIKVYDVINHSDSLMGFCYLLPPTVGLDVGDQDSNNIEELTAIIESENLEELNIRKEKLETHLSSLDSSINEMDKRIAAYESFHDSISPKFSLQERIKIRDQIEGLNHEILHSSTENINQLKLGLDITQFQLHLVHFLYVLGIILFPVRWVLIYFMVKK